MFPNQQHISNVSVGENARAYIGIFSPQQAKGSTQSCEHEARDYRDVLPLTNPEDDRAELISVKGKRVAGTCEWILENRICKEWLQGDTHLLSICGGPGQGKTMISIFLSQELQKDRKTIYYFCNSGNEKRNSASCILRSLLWQLVTIYPELSKPLSLDLETEKLAGRLPLSREALWRMFAKLCTQPPLGSVFCILDGLDECDEDSSAWLAAKLVDLLASDPSQAHNPSVNIAVISRGVLGLERIPALNLDPDNDELISLDVQRFVSTRVKDLSRFPGFNVDFGNEVEEELLARAEGKFLWVGFAMVELLKEKTLSGVRATMAVLPKGLPDLYARMLLQIDPKYREVSSRVLQWVTLAIRPLSREELTGALALKASPSINIQQTLSDCLIHCGPFVIEQDNRIRLVHQSARDYLLRQDIDENPGLEYFRLRPEQMHCTIAERCLDCMMDSADQLRSVRTNPEVLDEANNPFETSLLRYAFDYWQVHAHYASKEAEKLLDHPSGMFKGNSPLLEDWTNICGHSSLDLFDPFHIACYFGITPWAERILRMDEHESPLGRVNSRSYDGSTALMFAVQSERRDLVKLLLQNGSDVAAKDNSGYTALHWAARAGSETIVRLLLDRGADLTLRDTYNWTALHRAARAGSETTVRLLLNRGADIAIQNTFGWTALHLAARAGSETTVRLLLDRGSDIAIQNTFGWTALHRAARAGSEMTVGLLLDRGSDIAIQNTFGWSALHLAARAGSESTVRLLLDRGANVHTRNGRHRTALDLARESGSTALSHIIESAMR